MTMLFKKAPPNHCTRCKEEDVVMAIDKSADRILSYQRVVARTKFEFPVVSIEIFRIKTLAILLVLHINIASVIFPASNVFLHSLFTSIVALDKLGYIVRLIAIFLLSYVCV